MIFLRSSAMPLAFRCPGSVRRDGLLIEDAHPAAALGTAVHEALRSLSETNRLDWGTVPDIAKRYGCTEQDVRILCAQACQLWNQVSDSFQGALSEVSLTAALTPELTLTGHVDLLATRGTVARVADWKSGFKDSDYSHQMRAYGALVLLDNSELTECTVTVLWIREKEIENYTLTRDDAYRWIQRLSDEVMDWNGVFRPGNHCQFCPRSAGCEAANALVRRDIAVMTDRELVGHAECELALMAPEHIIELEQKASLVTAYAARVRDAIRKHVADNGDVVANGVRLTIAEEERRHLDPIKAWPVLESAGFGDEEFAQCVELRPSKVDNIVAKRMPRGKGAGAVRDIRAKLAAAGAVGTTTKKKLTTRRA
jgi:hypothetical protein